jgi:hypothetical protein
LNILIGYLQDVSVVKARDGSPSPAPTIEPEFVNLVTNNFGTDQPSNIRPLPPVNDIPCTLSSENIQQEAVTPVFSLGTKPKLEKPGFLPSQPPQRDPFDPRSWTVSDVCQWLESNEISDHIVEIFKHEQINGKSLFLLPLDNLGAMGVTAFGQKLELAKLIGDLKEESILREHGMGGMGSGVGNVVGGRSVGMRMEDGKGAPVTDAPPSYSAA